MLFYIPPENMNSFSVTRTFHPVGQGAFYSEMFETSSGKFIMVYDCGATNSKTAPKALCKEIKDSFHEDQYDEKGRLIVDVLFLSHFHNDHLNGVAHLAPKVVICPFVNDDYVLMLQLINHFQSEWNIGAMRDPGSLFSNQPRIMRVSTIDPERSLEETNRPYTLDNLSDTITSGTRIGVKSQTVDLTDIWCFIPFNFHYKERLDEFKKLLEERVTEKCAGGLSFDELKANPTEFIKKHNVTLRTICDTFSGKTNDQSLIVYSGPVDSDYNGIFREYQCYESQGLHYGRRIHDNMPAAIYYGDITLRETLVKLLTTALASDTKYVGTIQLPHHGSDRSFHESVFYYYDKADRHPYNRVLYVMSAGSKSKTHPGKNVLLTLRRMHQLHAVVKENRDSSVCECWTIYYEKNGHRQR